MASNAASANNTLLVSRVQVGNAIKKALDLFVGRGRRYSVKELSNATGVPDRVIECAKSDPESADYRPLPLEALTSIEKFIGPDFTNVRLGLADQAAFLLPDGDETPPGQIAADNAKDNAEVTCAAIDGVFDRQERKALSAVGVRMMSRGAKLVALDTAA